MLKKIFSKFVSSTLERKLKLMKKSVTIINSLENVFSKLSDVDLRNKTHALQLSIQNGHTLDSVLHEAFAIIREAAKRTLNMRHFDVQILG